MCAQLPACEKLCAQPHAILRSRLVMHGNRWAEAAIRRRVIGADSQWGEARWLTLEARKLAMS
eukprot:6192228-Pleurochrysis_carterae.AAC.8